MIDGELMNDIEMLYQEDYLKYQEFITKGMDLSDSTFQRIVFDTLMDKTY